MTEVLLKQLLSFRKTSSLSSWSHCVFANLTDLLKNFWFLTEFGWQRQSVKGIAMKTERSQAANTQIWKIRMG